MSQPPKFKKKRKDAVQGITGITVSGYKSLAEECAIEIRPLTILAGANSSGKSSIMQPLLLLKQTLEATYDPGPLLINGPNVRFTSVDQFLSKLVGKESADSFAIRLEDDSANTLVDTFRKHPRKGIELVEMTIGSMTLRPDMSDKEIKALKYGSSLVVERTRCFFSLVGQSEHSRSSRTLLFTGSFEPNIRQLIHVPGLRGNPERTYKTTAVGSEFPGTFENYVASVIRHWQETKNKRLNDLGDALQTLGLTWKVETKRLDDTQIELRVGRTPRSIRGGARDMVSIADVGFGVSQILPVLVAVLTAEPGQLVYLEQPEMHLHPRAQFALAEVLADAAKRGVRVVAETHGSLLLLGVQALVAEGKLSPDLVKLHWFTRRDEGATEVSSVDLDEDGAFGDWPQDFDDVELGAQSRYIDAVDSRYTRR